MNLGMAIYTKFWKGSKIAHKIKGGIVYVGAIKLKMACQYLERYYKAGNRKHLEKLYEQVINVSNETISEFKNYLNPEN